MATYAPGVGVRPLGLTVPAAWWLAGTTLGALVLVYSLGVDQGAVSVFGGDTHVHEFLHDAHHLLAFPCH